MKKSKVLVKRRSNSDEPLTGEIIKVFSQSNITYFDEWSDLGIYNASLFKVNYGNSGEKLIRDEGVKSVSVQADMEDLELPRRREIELLIFSIVLSLFAAFGFDKTRQNEPSLFGEIFPVWGDVISLDAKWLIVCLGIYVHYIFLKNGRHHKLLKCMTILPISIWFLTYLLLNGTSTLVSLGMPEGENLRSFFTLFYYGNLSVIVYMFISVMLIKHLRPKLHPKKMSQKNAFIKKIIVKVFGV